MSIVFAARLHLPFKGIIFALARGARRCFLFFIPKPPTATHRTTNPYEKARMALQNGLFEVVVRPDRAFRCSRFARSVGLDEGFEGADKESGADDFV